MIVVAVVLAAVIGFFVALAARRRRSLEAVREAHAVKQRRGAGFEAVSVVVDRFHGPSCGCEACIENFVGASPIVDRVHGPSCGCEACLENYADLQEGGWPR